MRPTPRRSGRRPERFSGEFQENNRKLTADLERDVEANALEVGDVAPDFRLHQAGTDAERTLSASLADGPVVLSFYRGQW